MSTVHPLPVTSLSDMRVYWPETSIDVETTATTKCTQSGFAPWGDEDFVYTYNRKRVYRIRRKQNVKNSISSYGYLPPLNFRVDLIENEVDNGIVETSWLNYGNEVKVISQDHHFVLTEATWPSWESLHWSMHAEVLASFNRLVRDQRLSTVETLYEAKKSSNMILETIGTVTKAATAVRQGRLSEAAKLLGLAKPPRVLRRRNRRRIKRDPSDIVISPAKTSEEFANRWLAYRYGWIPLYSTVYGAMTVIYDIVARESNNRLTMIKTPRISRAITHKYDRGPFGLYSTRKYGVGGYALADFGVHVTEDARYSGQISAAIRIKNESLHTASQLGLTNPALVAWELIPFSFVADWFVNVSDVLSQLDTWVGKEFVHGSFTIQWESVVKATSYQRSVPDTAPYTVKWAKSATSKSRTLAVDRNVGVNQPPVVSLTFSIGLTPNRIADAVALFRQVVLH